MLLLWCLDIAICFSFFMYKTKKTTKTKQNKTKQNKTKTKQPPRKNSLLYCVPLMCSLCFITAMGVPMYEKPPPKYVAHEDLNELTWKESDQRKLPTMISVTVKYAQGW